MREWIGNNWRVYISIPVLIVLNALGAYSTWESNQTLSIFELGTACFMFGMLVAVLLRDLSDRLEKKRMFNSTKLDLPEGCCGRCDGVNDICELEGGQEL